MVFLHGLMGSSANWQNLVSYFPDHPLLIYDQRGHGRSFKPPKGNYRVEDYTQDLHLILKELQWPPVILVGHSMGGRNAMHFAHRFSHQVEKLVVEDMVPGAGLPIGKLLDSIPTPFPHREAAKNFMLGAFLEKQNEGLGESSRKVALFLLANLRSKKPLKNLDRIKVKDENREEKQEVDWIFNKEAILETVSEGRARTATAWKEVAELQCPILLLRGEHSTVVSREMTKKMAQSNPRIQCLDIPQAGHWIHAQQTELFAQALRNFINAPK